MLNIMKKNITAILLIGIFSWITIGAQAQRSKDGDNNSPVKIVPGKVSTSSDSKLWDFATFGLEGPASYTVSYVEIVPGELGEGGDAVAVSIPEGHRQAGVTWFGIDLNGAGLESDGDFYLRIHVVKRNVVDYGSNNLTIGTLAARPVPIDPDETVILIRYP